MIDVLFRSMLSYSICPCVTEDNNAASPHFGRVMTDVLPLCLHFHCVSAHGGHVTYSTGNQSKGPMISKDEIVLF